MLRGVHECVSATLKCLRMTIGFRATVDISKCVYSSQTLVFTNGPLFPPPVRELIAAAVRDIVETVCTYVINRKQLHVLSYKRCVPALCVMNIIIIYAYATHDNTISPCSEHAGTASANRKRRTTFCAWCGGYAI